MAVPESDARLAQEKEEESEEESEILEESPCGRWQKRREQVNQGNMPGIQSTFLAMDTEEGVEVVWNELLFTDKKAFKAHEEKIKTMFEQLVLVDHPNIVKLHKYWLDVKDSKARVIFITEYVSSGSLKQFLKKTKKNHKAMNARRCRRNVALIVAELCTWGEQLCPHSSGLSVGWWFRTRSQHDCRSLSEKVTAQKRSAACEVLQ
uniref:Nuclear receptor binding protein 2 n=1 Tax=Gallus gallus TaxID=9031 RepID=A0A8V0YD92_CHICK